jgi:hypothetical protein
MQVACGCEVHFQDHDKRLVLKSDEDFYSLKQKIALPNFFLVWSGSDWRIPRSSLPATHPANSPFWPYAMDPDSEIEVDFSRFLF